MRYRVEVLLNGKWQPAIRFNLGEKPKELEFDSKVAAEVSADLHRKSFEDARVVETGKGKDESK